MIQMYASNRNTFNPKILLQIAQGRRRPDGEEEEEVLGGRLGHVFFVRPAAAAAGGPRGGRRRARHVDPRHGREQAAAA